MDEKHESWAEADALQSLGQQVYPYLSAATSRGCRYKTAYDLFRLYFTNSPAQLHRDVIFRSHLLAIPHGYSARRSENMPSLPEFWVDVQAMGDWWIQTADQWDDNTLNEQITFEFLDGRDGEMSRIEMVMHLANHTSYHRGFVDEMLGQMGMNSPACDFPVYLRDMSASDS